MNIIDNANNLLEKYDNIITDLYEQYKYNNYIMNKLDNHINGFFENVKLEEIVNVQ